MNINIKNILKMYGEKKVLENFSAHIEEGAVCVFMGESGSGKTTLLRIIMGLETFDCGSIKGTENLRFGTVFQEDRLVEHISAISNLALVSHATKNEILKLLAGLGLEKADCIKPIKELSGGQARRVAIARALIAKADILVMDEPFKGLDDRTRRMVIEEINNRRNGRTLIISTHDKEDAESLGGEIISLPML